MDTATHLVMGITLGSLATLDPAIAQSDIGPPSCYACYNCWFQHS